MKPFRFGIGIGQINSRADLAEKARKIEALGYDTLTLPDHLTDCLAPVPAMVSAASATTRLRIGTNVLNNDLRHPVLVAREAAAVDLLSDGRLQLGLGAGSIKSEYDEAGFSFDPGSVRVERLAEAAPPDVSAWRAAEIDKRVELVREAARDRYPQPELNALVQRVVVTEDRRAAAEELAQRWPQLTPDDILESPYLLIGTVEEMVEDLRARRERWGISYWIAHEPYLDAFAPVVA